MTAHTRIYHVFDKQTGTNRLVRAGSPAQAVRHVVKNRFDVEVAGQDLLVELLPQGFVVEESGKDADVEQQPEPQAEPVLDTAQAA
jgi:hypothetical protein